MLYLQFTAQILYSLVPSDKYNRAELYMIFFIGFVGQILYYTDSGAQVIYILFATLT